jgi:hypothetical protein
MHQFAHPPRLVACSNTESRCYRKRILPEAARAYLPQSLSLNVGRKIPIQLVFRLLAEMRLQLQSLDKQTLAVREGRAHQGYVWAPLNYGATSMQHTHSQQSTPTEQRSLQEAANLRKEARGTPPGIERERLLRRARQAETASRVSEWLASKGLQPPT